MSRTLIIGAALIAGCTQELTEPKSTQFQIEVVTPSDPGDINHRLAVGSGSGYSVTVNISAFDENDKPETDYNNQLQVYTHYLGTLTPYLGGTPLTTIQMTNGVAMNQTFTLPPVFGPTTIWFSDDDGSNAVFAAGTSETLWFRDPFLSDVQRPVSETALDAADTSELDDKNVTINTSQYGSNGRLVVTSVYSQGYTVADVQCTDAAGDPPCIGSDYDSMDIFSYSAALDEQNRYVVEGQTIDGFAGGVSPFDGLIEIGFPQTFVYAATVDVNIAREPAPVLFDPSWLTTNRMAFKHAQSAAIQVDGATVCPLDADYTTYNEWKIDPAGGANCASLDVIDVVTAGTLDLDPGTLVGKQLTSVVGILRPVAQYGIWVIYPRSMADITE